MSVEAYKPKKVLPKNKEMKIALIQISDVHLRLYDTKEATQFQNPVLSRGELIAQAVNSICAGIEAGLLIVSGDTAFSGKAEEYSMGVELLDRIRSEIAFPKTNAIPIFTIAGNHDCDFKKSGSVRKILIDSIKSQDLNDKELVSQCAVVQEAYRSFDKTYDFESYSRTHDVDNLYKQRVLEWGGKKVVLHLLNSAWISQNPEHAGSLFYPIEMVKEQLSQGPPADIAISVIHHPFNWYWPENSRQLKSLLEEHSDIIVTGHEHVSGSYVKRFDSGEQNEYLEGGVLQETGQPSVSSFNVVLFDATASQQQTYQFVFDGTRYIPQGEPYWRPFERNKRLTRNQFEFTKSFSAHVDDPGASFTHPLKFPVLLSDIFVYPDFRDVRYDRESADQHVVRGRDFVTFVLNNSHVVVIGEEKAGKSCLAKTLVKDLYNNGKITILIEGDSLRNCLDQTRLSEIVNEKLLEQYGSGHTDQFWQLEIGARAVIVDDFTKTRGNRKSKDLLSTLLKERFGIVVLMTNEVFRVEQISKSGPTNNSIIEFKQCAMLQFGLALRSSLIAKWHMLGREYTEDEIQAQRAIKRAEDQISNIISVDFLPSYPVFVLILLQQLESSSKLTTTSGSFGYLYEVLVTSNLSRGFPRDQVDAVYTYLSEFAYCLYKVRRRALTEDMVSDWHETYRHEYRQPSTDYKSDFQKLASAGVIDISRGDYRFRYKYLYYFFVARYFRDNINKPEIQESIVSLSQRLHHEESANIVIFLCHLSKDERILTAMLSAAKNLFKDSVHFDLSEQTKFLNKVQEQMPELFLGQENPVDNRQQMLEAQDARALTASTDKVDEVVEVDEAEAELTELALINASFKTIQILGQVLKNFSGSLKGEPKRQLVEECYSLGLRVLGKLFVMVEDGLPEIAQQLSHFARLRLKEKSPSDDVADVYSICISSRF